MKNVFALSTLLLLCSALSKGESLTCDSPEKRCVFGPLPVTSSAMFSNAALEINLVNPSAEQQTVDVQIMGYDGIAFNDNLASLVALGFVDGFDCDMPATGIDALLGTFRRCTIKSALKVMPPGTSLTLPIQVKADSKKVRSGAMYKIQVVEPKGNIMALIFIHKNELQNWAALGCAVSGCGVAGGVGTVSNTIIYPLNGGKPF